jgi:hypothetical protein
MNCPNCNSPSSDGKKYCADCGTPLDPQMRHVEVLVKAQVERAVQEKFKDQKLVDIETSQAIAERLHGWAKLLAFFVAIPLAIILVALGFAGVEKYSDFKNMIGSVENEVKPKIEQAKSDSEQAQKTAREAKADAEASKKTIESATAEAKKQLGSATELARSVKALSDRVSGVEQQTSDQLKGSGKRVDARVAELDSKIDAAIKDIAEQQRRLASTDELVKTLFSKGTTEYFQTKTNGPNVVVYPVSNGAIVYLLLGSVPIDQTVQLKWRVASQPRNSYNIRNNLVMFFWGESAEGLRQFPLEVTYVPDPTSKTAPFKTLVLKDNAIFADETKLTDLPH